MTTDHTQFDILIVGGGLTGKMMALTLSYSGYKIGLMAPHHAKKDAFDRRSTTIHHAGHLMLDALAVADRLKDVCLLYTSPSPRDLSTSRMPSSA